MPRDADPVAAATTSDEDLVREILEGSRAAEHDLYERWRARLRRFAAGRMQDRLKTKLGVSDVVQEALVTTMARLARFEDRGAGSFGAWIRRICKNKIRDAMRRFFGTGKRDPRRETSTDASGAAPLPSVHDLSPSGAMSAKEADARLAAALASLSPADRASIRLVDERGLTFVEAGRELGCTEEAARKRHDRAVERLTSRYHARHPSAPADPTRPGVGPGDRLGPCRLGATLGTGGMGVVYRGVLERDVGDDRAGTAVAVKVLRPALSRRRGFLQRFQREARIGRRVASPYVVRTLHAGAQRVRGATVPYLVTELVEGRTLRAALDAGGRVGAAACRAIARDLAAGLVAIHAAGALHRDVKPDNVLVGADGRARLADLGLARLYDDPSVLTSSGDFVGTMAYAAPEQFQPQPSGIDARADLYALGLTLFELATGAPPFRPRERVRQLQTHHPAPTIRSRRPGFDASLDALVAALLADDPAARPPSAAAVLAILERRRG